LIDISSLVTQKLTTLRNEVKMWS